MARVTVEDCLRIIPNRFELSVLASYRAKEISKGAPIKIEKSDNKDSVTALREISYEKHKIENLRTNYVHSLQQNAKADDVLEEDTNNINDISKEETGTNTITQEEGNILDENTEDNEFISVDDYSFGDESDLDD